MCEGVGQGLSNINIWYSYLEKPVKKHVSNILLK